MFERVFLFYKPSLERLGMNVTVRTVDLAQYENRLRTWDFDITTFAWRETQMPGGELHDYYGSQAADQSGSDNVIGIKNPAVDAMIEHVVLAKNYDDLAAAAKALDRILLWNNYRRAAMELQQAAHGTLGSVRPSGSAAEIRHLRIPDLVVVGCRKGGEDRRPLIAFVSKARAATAAQNPARAVGAINSL